MGEKAHPQPLPRAGGESEGACLPPSRSREGSGVGTVAGVRRPTLNAQRLRREATPAERKLWRALSASQCGAKFSRQMPVGDYVCDFLSRSAMLAIEVDGDSHAATVDRDARRTRFIESRGIRIVRFGNADVMGNLEGVVAVVRAVVAERTHPQPLPRAGGEAERTHPQPLPRAGGERIRPQAAFTDCPPPTPPASGRGGR
ncbi:endonuclease domain-containing protein [Sphingomonas bacterium]|uniref:endonuclease domain-containing protein n=1 Tax=Sphingomonas bacterium TaxID=1895847 RepID=UPI0020C6BF0B|nr:DUF559 domain-containing protein [Sphingomonas bacterium]